MEKPKIKPIVNKKPKLLYSTIDYFRIIDYEEYLTKKNIDNINNSLLEAMQQIKFENPLVEIDTSGGFARNATLRNSCGYWW